MKAETLLVWAIFTFCCALLCTGEDAQRDKASGDLTKVRGPRGEAESGRLTQEQGAMPLSDEPAEVVEAEPAKPKKKKSPEEIEAGKMLPRAELELDKHQPCNSNNFFE